MSREQAIDRPHAEKHGVGNRSWSSKAATMLNYAESAVLVLIGIVLVLVAILLLGSSVGSLLDAVFKGQMHDSAVTILDSVLLVMMTMEIVYTVAISLESHSLVAEPFLVIGAIAAIRRMLVITATSTKLEDQPERFRSTLMELGLLALIVVAMAVSIYVLRRSQQYGGKPQTRVEKEAINE